MLVLLAARDDDVTATRFFGTGFRDENNRGLCTVNNIRRSQPSSRRFPSGKSYPYGNIESTPPSPHYSLIHDDD